MISFNFLNEILKTGPLGAVLAITILAILGLYKDHKDKDKQIDSLEEKRVEDAKDTTSHVTVTLESINDTMKAVLIALDRYEKK